MRFHLGFAALILIGGIVAGWWFQRTPDSPNGPVEMRNAIATANAVVVTFQRQGNAAGPATTITFIRGKGWTWEQAASRSNSGGLVISTSSQTLAAAAPGCYIAIQNVPTPVVPGVNLASDLGHAPGLRISGDIYTYEIGADDDAPGVRMVVSEDLGNVAQGQSYTAQLKLEGDGHPAGGAAQPGTYAIRRATAPERKTAEALLRDAAASPVAPFTLEQRAVMPGQQAQMGALQMVSPKGCPAAAVLNPAVLGKSADVSVFTRTNTKAILGHALEADDGRVSITGALPLDLPIEAPAEELLQELSGVTPQTIPLKQGATFGLPSEGSQGGPRVVMAISACQPEPWFPC